ncbi:hypothetical protein LNKW23_23370 [Paralimibaculum aggregatum]|uniref:Uncharacterized protein n=1 Tax=Paralimibaculum aggregatum TaxID=3036245 RepID=A0ABQ6LLE6_9RHOB|nr:hypothetical protein [Limibaculum sp. NKW23]GMG83124.1 hypothetical protein LNKW23_23370 [Limibaculum sp. NKW23]
MTDQTTAADTAAPARLTPEEESKDAFFQRAAMLAEEMVAAHGKEFAMGTLVLAARWIAENRLGSSGRAN